MMIDDDDDDDDYYYYYYYLFDGECCRFTCSLIYYALAFNTGELQGSVYLNTFIAGAVEIPAYFLCMFLMDWSRMGRKRTGCTGLIVSAVSSFLCIPMLMFG